MPTTSSTGDDTRWRARAACRDRDPEWFFPTAVTGPGHRAQVQRAKAVCARCPVLTPCRRWALEDLADGIAGGLTEHERRQARARTPRPRTARPVATDPGDIPASAGRDAVRAAAVEAVVAGVPRPEVAARFRVTPRTVERWLARHRAATPTPTIGGEVTRHVC